MADTFPSPRTIPSMLKYWSETDPETPAFVFAEKDGSITYTRREVFQLAGKMASKLKKVGLTKGDAVAIIVPDGANCPDLLISEYGIQMAGCVSFHALGDLKSGEDTIQPLQICQAKAIILDPNFSLFKDIFKGKFSRRTEREYGAEVVCPKLPHLKYLIYIKTASEEDLETQLKREKEIFMENVKSEDRACFVGTSGTTSLRKVVPVTHKSLLLFSRNWETACPAARYYNDRSFGWIAGYPVNTSFRGISRILRNMRKQDLPSDLDVIVREQCSSAMLSPGQTHDIYMQLKSEDAPKIMLDVLLLGGQPIRKSTVAEGKSFAKTVVVIYGSTEALAVAYYKVENLDDFKDYCTGYPFPEVDVRVVDPSGKVVPRGQTGKIQVRSPCLFEGYLTAQGVPDRTPLTSDGWFEMEDLGHLDETGKLYVNGRGSDAIMHGCTLVFPHLIEDVIRQCPLVEEVVVVPVPDEIMHHQMCACIQAKKPDNVLSQIEAFISESFIELPNQVCFPKPEYILLFDVLPINKNGKMNRKKITAVAKSRLKV